MSHKREVLEQIIKDEINITDACRSLDMERSSGVYTLFREAIKMLRELS